MRDYHLIVTSVFELQNFEGLCVCGEARIESPGFLADLKRPLCAFKSVKNPPEPLALVAHCSGAGSPQSPLVTALEEYLTLGYGSSLSLKRGRIMCILEP